MAWEKVHDFIWVTYIKLQLFMVFFLHKYLFPSKLVSCIEDYLGIRKNTEPKMVKWKHLSSPWIL